MLAAQLRQRIAEGKFAPGAMVESEIALAQSSGLARNTVRRGIAQLVDEGLLERRPGKGVFVREPDTATRQVQVVMPNMAWPHCVQIAQGALTLGRQRGIQVQVYDAHGQMDLDLRVISNLPQSGMHGALAVSLHDRRFSQALVELQQAGYPLVLVDQRLRDVEVPSVEIDNYGGGYLVGQKLIQAGHRRIGFFGPLQSESILRRLDGLRDAVLDAGIVFDRSLVADMEGDNLINWLSELGDRTRRALRSLLDRSDPPTALFDGGGDAMAYAYQELRGRGLRIPQDMSVASFDDQAICELLDPPVASLRHPWQEAGRRAMQMLMTKMGTPRQADFASPAEHTVLSGQWMQRDSLKDINP